MLSFSCIITRSNRTNSDSSSRKSLMIIRDYCFLLLQYPCRSSGVILLQNTIAVCCCCSPVRIITRAIRTISLLAQGEYACFTTDYRILSHIYGCRASGANSFSAIPSQIYIGSKTPPPGAGSVDGSMLYTLSFSTLSVLQVRIRFYVNR